MKCKRCDRTTLGGSLCVEHLRQKKRAAAKTPPKPRAKKRAKKRAKTHAKKRVARRTSWVVTCEKSGYLPGNRLVVKSERIATAYVNDLAALGVKGRVHAEPSR